MTRRQEEAENHWPGFVDALSTIVMVVTFLLIILGVVIFVIAQQIKASAGVSDEKSDAKKEYFAPITPEMVAENPEIVKALAAEAKQKADEAKAKAEQTKTELELEQVKLETAQAEAQKAAAATESEQVKLEIAEAEAEQVKSEAVEAQAAAEQAKSEAAQAQAEAEQAKSESTQAQAEADQAKSESAQAQAEAEQAKSEAAEAEAESQSQADKLAAQKLEAEKLSSKAKINLAAELRQDRVTELEINGQKIISQQVEDSKEITIASEEVSHDFKANIVQSANEILTLIFDGKSVLIDENSAIEIQKFLSVQNVIKQQGKIEIRSYVNLNQSSMGERRRMAFYRAMGARNELLKLELDPNNISIKVKEVDDEKLGGIVKLYIKP